MTYFDLHSFFPCPQTSRPYVTTSLAKIPVHTVSPPFPVAFPSKPPTNVFVVLFSPPPSLSLTHTVWLASIPPTRTRTHTRTHAHAPSSP